MATSTRNRHHVRVSDTSHQLLRDLAAETGQSMTAVLDAALENYRRELFYADVAAAWRTMETELMEEYSALEGTIGDGLERDEW